MKSQGDMEGVVLATIAIQLLSGHHVQTRPQLCAVEIIISHSEIWNIKAEWKVRGGRSNPGSVSHPLLEFNDTACKVAPRASQPRILSHKCQGKSLN